MATREALERLARNPHYKMTAKQIAELRRLREQDATKQVEHRTGFDTHPTGFTTHPTEPESPQ